MTFTLVTTRHFERQARKFLRKHPDLKSTVRSALDQLHRDPFKSSLKLHGLTGKLAGTQAVSITHSYRVTLTVQVIEREVILLDIGTHDDIYR